MELTIGSEIRIKEPTPELVEWCNGNLVVDNPEYQNRKRRGLWLGRTPETISLYRVEGKELVLPTGTGKQIKKFVPEHAKIRTDLAYNGILDYKAIISLYDYQKAAVDALSASSCGILQSPCGSGKTQMGIALAVSLKLKTLWVTHTQDLLNQSYDRARQYMPESILGTITAGKVHIGSHITFATVQTLSKIDLTQYKYTWDVVIVDECHRLAGSPTQVTMFYKVMNHLAARHKYGLSATVHRSDGMIKSTFAVIGPVVCHVPDEAVAEKTMKVRIVKRDTEVPIARCCLDTDGTLDYSALLDYLAGDIDRCIQIGIDLKNNVYTGHSCLVLSSRLQHLHNIMNILPDYLQEKAVMIDGSMTSKKGKAQRAQAIEDMRQGKKSILFASYSLAKEGLDIPCLDRLFLISPQKDYAVITQSIGRIARVAEGKTDAICYDYVDDIPFCKNAYKKRVTHYKKAGCIL